MSKRLRNHRGLTLIELLLAAFIFSIVAGAGFQFYSKMHMAAMAQDSISELQHRGRTTVREICRELKLAGFQIDPHIPYRLSGDTLAIYFAGVQPVDTVLYYTEEYTTSEYSAIPGWPNTKKLFKILKKTNSEMPLLFADMVSDLTIAQIDTKTIAVAVTVQAERADDKYEPNNGFRSFSLSERAVMRNVKS